MKRNSLQDSKNKIVLFGAGNNGRQALKKYGMEQVAYFCDNDPCIQGTEIGGITVIPFEEMVELHRVGYIVIVTPSNNWFMLGQLEQADIFDYLIYKDNEHEIVSFDSQGSVSYWDIKIAYYTEQCRKYDWLDDISELKTMAAEVLQQSKENKQIPISTGRLGESFYYGNLQTLYKYAGCPIEDMKYAPNVCHANPSPVFSAQFYRSAVVVSGTYYREKIRKRYPYVPIFTVGPYIYYAESYYSPEKLKKIKKTIGKMLLVMLPHSMEFIERKYEKKKFIDSTAKKYSGKFDTIWLCVLWTDVNDSVCEYAKSCGIHIVSAGFRFDDLFNKRLRTIIELCDTLVCGDIGTFISYALCLNKPVARLDISKEKSYWEVEDLKQDIEKKIQISKEYFEYKKHFFNIFDETPNHNESQMTWANPLAGFDQIRSKEYMRSIFEISKDIWIQSKGLMEEYPKSVRDVFFHYYMKNDVEKMVILKQAVGGYVD